jgi:hypothetical protein
MNYQNNNTNNYATILSIRSNNCITPSFDRNNKEPLNAPIKKKKRIVNHSELGTVRRNLLHYFDENIDSEYVLEYDY